MSDGISLFLTAYDSADGASDVLFATTPVTRARIDWLLNKGALVSQLRDQDSHFLRLTYLDDSITYYQAPDDFWDRDPDEDPLIRAYHEAEFERQPVVISNSICPSFDLACRTEAEETNITPNGVFWQALSKYSDITMTTMYVRKSYLLLAKCHLVGPEELPEVFRSLIEADPALAVSILEDGLEVVGNADQPRNLVDELPSDVLALLFRHPRSDIRQRAIVALGNRAKKLGVNPQVESAGVCFER